MSDELSREAFTELIVSELKRQGVFDKEKAPSLTNANRDKWNAEKTYRALLFDQPRAIPSGLLELALLIEKKVVNEESKEETFSDWFVLNTKFKDGVCSIVQTHPSPEASRLASAIFVDCVYFGLVAANLEWSELDPVVLSSFSSS